MQGMLPLTSNITARKLRAGTAPKPDIIEGAAGGVGRG